MHIGIRISKTSRNFLHIHKSISERKNKTNRIFKGLKGFNLIDIKITDMKMLWRYMFMKKVSWKPSITYTKS